MHRKQKRAEPRARNRETYKNAPKQERRKSVE